jgi:cytochrome c oxidase subunit 2
MMAGCGAGEEEPSAAMPDGSGAARQSAPEASSADGGGDVVPAAAPDTGVSADTGTGTGIAPATPAGTQTGTEIDRRVARILHASAGASPTVEPEAIGAIAMCAVCHGPRGEGNTALDAPRIGGLPDWYVARQLDYFRRGVRGGDDADKYGTQMRAVALGIGGDHGIGGLARWVATLAPEAPDDTAMGNAERGAELYTVCAACHGADGQGSEALNTPSLVGQYGWYLIRQLEHYRSGLRGTHPDDVYGMQMRPIVLGTLTSDEQIADVVAYIKTLPRIAGRTDAPPSEPAEPTRGTGD